MTKIEKLVMECASGKHGDAYDAAKSACLELGDIIEEYLLKKKDEYHEEQQKYGLYDWRRGHQEWAERAIIDVIDNFFKEEQK